MAVAFAPSEDPSPKRGRASASAAQSEGPAASAEDGPQSQGRASPLLRAPADPHAERLVQAKATLAAAFANMDQTVARMKVGSTWVSIADLQSDYTALRLQQAVLPGYGIEKTPCAHVLADGQLRFIPYDYGFRTQDPALHDPTLPMDVRIERARTLIGTGMPFGVDIENTGLTIIEISADFAHDEMMDAMAREVVARATPQPAALQPATAQPATARPAVLETATGGVGGSIGSAPPLQLFTVTTANPNRRVAYTSGHFISTHGFFGNSTPAVRHMAPGYYMFGVYRDTGPVFPEDGLLCKIPDVASFHLDL